MEGLIKVEGGGVHYGNFIVLILLYFIFYFAAKEGDEIIYKITPVKRQLQRVYASWAH